MGQSSGAQEDQPLPQLRAQIGETHFQAAHNYGQVPEVSPRVVSVENQKATLVKRIRLLKETGQGFHIGDLPGLGLRAQRQGEGPRGTQAGVFLGGDPWWRRNIRATERVLRLVQTSC